MSKTATSADVGTDELAKIAIRIQRILDQQPVIPTVGLLYRLCEVGAPASRLDIVLATRALAELTNNRRPRRGRVPRGPWSPLPEIFVDPNQSSHSALGNAKTCCEQLRHLTAELLPAEKLARAIADTVINALEQIQSGVQVENVTTSAIEPEPLGDDITTSRFTATVSLRRGSDRPIEVWITNDWNPVGLSEPALWQHLIDCIERDSIPLILARKLTVATFPVLKTLGARGLQLHHRLDANQVTIETTNALGRKLGLPPIRAVDTLTSPEGITAMRRIVQSLYSKTAHENPTGPAKQDREAARRGAQTARQLRLYEPIEWPAASQSARSQMRGRSHATAQRYALVERWAIEAQLNLPAQWIDAIRRHAIFAAYAAPRRRNPAQLPSTS